MTVSLMGVLDELPNVRRRSGRRKPNGANIGRQPVNRPTHGHFGIGMMRSCFFLLLSLTSAAAFKTPTSTFATFGNAQTKAFIKLWQPKPLPVNEGETLLPNSKDVMKR